MSVTSVGPAVSLDGPLPVAPEHSLLNTPGVVKERDATRVLNGATVWGYPTGCSELWEPCSEGTFRVKSSDSDMPTPTFDAYVVYKPVICSALGLSDPEELNQRIARVVEATESAAIELALAGGPNGPSSANPFFGDANVTDVTPTPGTAVSPKVGLALLENAIGETCRKGMIHATPATVAHLQPLQFIDPLVTTNGTPVVSADGLIGLETDDLAAPDVGEDWMIATGPVEVYLGPIVAFDTRSSLDRSDNTLVFRAERYVLSVWDTALQTAVLVDWTL